MAVEMKAPSPGESVTEVQIASWLKSDGDFVEKDEVLCEIESDKATLELAAEASGQLKTVVAAGEIVPVGSVICTIDTEVKGGEQPKAAAKPATSAASPAVPSAAEAPASAGNGGYAAGAASPAAAKLMAEHGMAQGSISGTGPGGRVTKDDVMQAVGGAPTTAPSAAVPQQPAVVKLRPGERREQLSMLRRSLARRLVAVKNETAMLTTFNEADMSGIKALRKKHQEAFTKKYGVKLGFMSFFVRAVVAALKEYPAVNAYIDGNDVIFHDFADIGIAVSAPKGLMVPVIRGAEKLNSGEIEQAIVELATKARDGKLSIEEMSGGTFSITNGGVFGSMLSTPILNPPQSGILGMHKIMDRPVVIDGKLEIRPMMYLALSYDHRIIDGRESVGFLCRVKELLEDPEQLLSGI